MDLLPAAAAAAGASLPTDRTIDGVNLLPLLKKGAVQPDRTIFWRDGHYQAVQTGGYKLQVSERPKKAWLFNLRKTRPSRKTWPRRCRRRSRMRALIDAHNKTQREPLFPAIGEMPVTIDKTLRNRDEGRRIHLLARMTR